MSIHKGIVPQSVLQKIRDRVDIGDVISRYVTLSKAGQNLRGLCPFHTEKTPSFSVNPVRQMFYCFGCGVGGDAFTFLMKKEGMEFPEAVSELARQAGVDLIQDTSGHRGGILSRRQQLEGVHVKASEWFRENLRATPQGDEARAYLAQRGIETETWDRFGLGYAIRAWDGLLRHLVQTGSPPEDIMKAGLAVARDDRGARSSQSLSCYDRFRDRIIFPITNVRGQIIAFGGRAIHDDTPKYLNSPETPLFKKSDCLFGLNLAREAVHRHQALLLVEGYFDVLVLHQAGIQHVVAPLGTALTADHVNMIRRLTPMVFLVFDGDSAGVRAVLRTLDLFSGSGVSVKVVVLPSGDDPDSFVRKSGVEAFRGLMDAAVPLLDFTVEQCLQGMAQETPEGRIRSVDDVLNILMKTDNNIELEEQTRRVAERLGIRQELLIERYQKLKPAAPRSPRPRQPVSSRSPSSLRKTHKEERDLVAFLVRGELEPVHLQALVPEYFTVPRFRAIVETALRHIGETGLLEWPSFSQDMTDDAELQTMMAELTLEGEHFDDAPSYILGCLEALKHKFLRAQMDQLIAQLRVAERENREEDVRKINHDINQLRKQKAASNPSVL